MKININGKSIEYTLEEEKTAGDVLEGVTAWLEESGMLAAGIQLDGKDVTIDEEDWKSTKIEDFENLDIRAVNYLEARVSQLQTARDFFSLMRNAAYNSDKDTLKELSSGYKDVKKLLPHLLAEGTVNADSDMLDKPLEDAGFPPADGKECNFQAIAACTEGVIVLLNSRLQETAEPHKKALSTALSLASIAENLEETAVQLQTGKDKEAMSTIIVISELLQSLMRSLSWLPPSENAKEISSQMSSMLSELETALQTSDTVLMGDLLEYEIKPWLQELPERLNIPGEKE